MVASPSDIVDYATKLILKRISLELIRKLQLVWPVLSEAA